MNAIRTKDSNATYTAKGCYDLPALILETDNGTKIIETCWELSSEELKEVQRTGKVYVRLVGSVPPMNVEVCSFKGENES